MISDPMIVKLNRKIMEEGSILAGNNSNKNAFFSCNSNNTFHGNVNFTSHN